MLCVYATMTGLLVECGVALNGVTWQCERDEPSVGGCRLPPLAWMCARERSEIERSEREKRERIIQTCLLFLRECLLHLFCVSSREGREHRLLLSRALLVELLLMRRNNTVTLHT